MGKAIEAMGRLARGRGVILLVNGMGGHALSPVRGRGGKCVFDESYHGIQVVLDVMRCDAYDAISASFQ